jgi:hypothetical protein
MSTLKQLQGDVALRMRRGDTFASVETQVIDASGLSDDRQRREAVAHIDVLAATPSSAKLPDTRLRLV